MSVSMSHGRSREFGRDIRGGGTLTWRVLDEKGSVRLPYPPHTTIGLISTTQLEENTGKTFGRSTL